MIKVSIIVPIYKTEKYLRQCVNSILCQTYQNIEVILVDDGSPDACPNICDEYAEKDHRVIVIHKKNGRPSDARKAGIHRACGDYVMFVDSDDWIEPNTLEVCVSFLSHNTGTDCLIFSYIREYSQKSETAHVMDKADIFEGLGAQEKIHRRLFGLSGEELKHPERLENLGSCCMKLYTIACARKGRFFDTKDVGSSEDVLFNIFALSKCKRIVYINQPFYHYRKRAQTITSTYRPKLVKQWSLLFDLMEKEIERGQLGPEYINALSNRITLSIFGIGMNEISNQSSSIFEKKMRLQNYVETQRYQKAFQIMDSKYLPLPWKALVWNAGHKCILLVLVELYLIRLWRRMHKLSY